MTGDAAPRFGNYVLEERLAIGGMAEVFRARRIGVAGFSRTVVIKRILPMFCQDKAFVEMFIDEANTGAQLRHSNIVAIDDFGEIDGRYFLAMEFIQGVDAAKLLASLVADGRAIPWEVGAFVLREVLSALDYAHRKKAPDGGPLNVVHRDVSPHNVLLSTAGEVKLTDFGIARARTRLHQTSANVVKGKLAYMAPEQARAQVLDGRADLFAAGVSVYELLAGRRPFIGKNESEVVANLLRGRRDRLSTLRPDVPPALEAVIDGLLEIDRNKRFESASAALSMLDPIVSPSASRTLAAIIVHYFFPSAASTIRTPVGAIPESLPRLPAVNTANAGALAQSPPVPSPMTPATTPPPPRLSHAPEASSHPSAAPTEIRTPVAASEGSAPSLEAGSEVFVSSPSNPHASAQDRTAVSAVFAAAIEATAATESPARAVPSTIDAPPTGVRPQDAVTRTSLGPIVQQAIAEQSTEEPSSEPRSPRDESLEFEKHPAAQHARGARPSPQIVLAIALLAVVATIVLVLVQRRAARGAVSAQPARTTPSSQRTVRSSSSEPTIARPSTTSPPESPQSAAPAPTPSASTRTAPVTDVLETARTARSSSTVAAPIAAASPRPARVATSRPHTAARSFGTLAIQATPWAELTIDGVTEGLTPFYRRVSAGTHRIVLVHRPTGRRAIRAVRVRPETVTRIEVDLR